MRCMSWTAVVDSEFVLGSGLPRGVLVGMSGVGIFINLRKPELEYTTDYLYPLLCRKEPVRLGGHRSTSTLETNSLSRTTLDSACLTNLTT